MNTSRDDKTSDTEQGGRFITTHWSVVLRAGRSNSPEAQAALADLCRDYWYPLYVYVRRQGYDADAAKDAVQDFFVKLSTKRFFTAARREKGKFRCFLLMAMKRFLVNEWRRGQAVKRGGGQPVISIDQCLAESRYGLEPAHQISPDILFDRQWAMTLLDIVLSRLEAEYAAAGKSKLFECLRGSIAMDTALASYTEISAKTGMTEGAVKVAVHRLRSRYREILRQEIARTVADPEEIKSEIRHLFSVFST